MPDSDNKSQGPNPYTLSYGGLYIPGGQLYRHLPDLSSDDTEEPTVRTLRSRTITCFQIPTCPAVTYLNFETPQGQHQLHWLNYQGGAQKLSAIFVGREWLSGSTLGLTYLAVPHLLSSYDLSTTA